MLYFESARVVGFVEGVFDGDDAVIVDGLLPALVHSDDPHFFFFLPQIKGVVLHEASEDGEVVAAF